MNEENNLKEVVAEIQGASEEELREVIEEWFDRTRTQGLKLGAKYMALGAMGIIKKHLVKPGKKPSLRSYERCIDELNKFFMVQLKEKETQQNESEQEENS